MTCDEADELVADLDRAGVRIERTEPQQYPNEDKWQVVCWSERIGCFYTITNARLFRETVRDGLAVVLPRGALDQK